MAHDSVRSGALADRVRLLGLALVRSEMWIKLRLYGNLRRYAENNCETSELDVAAGTTIKALLDVLRVPEGGWWMAAVNDQVVDPDTLLQDDDLLEVFDPVGGGCPAVS